MRPSNPDYFATDEVYVCPDRSHWPVYDSERGCYEPGLPDDSQPSMLDLTVEEPQSLEIVDLYCDFKRQYGDKGTAPVFNYKKLSVIRAEWKKLPVRDKLPTGRAQAAYNWFCKEHPVYRNFIRRHDEHLRKMANDPSIKIYIPTAQLLLHLDGIEIASRPLLYPHHAYGDSDLRSRLRGVHIRPAQVPNMKLGFLRKALSPCVGYNMDPKLIFLLHDMALSRSTIATITVAEQRGLSPEVLADNRKQSEAYWRHEQDYLCDIVRQMARRCCDAEKHPNLWAYCHASVPRSLAYPNVFITIAPAEWMFPLHMSDRSA